jgi:hypothetical protein
MSKSQIRKIAYKYIKEWISKSHEISGEAEQSPAIPLNDLILLKQGMADPSAELIASLKQSLRGSVTEAEINAHFLTPFRQHKTD